MQVEMTKHQGLYNKPSATVHPGASATGTLLQYNTIYNFNDPAYFPKCHFRVQIITKMGMDNFSF